MSTSVVRSAAVLAEKVRLRGYDAVHLASALESGATVFASADGRLLEAARQHGLATSNPLDPS